MNLEITSHDEKLSTKTSEDLMSEVKHRGCIVSMSELMRRYQANLLRYGRGVCEGLEHDAAEWLTQEVFIRVWSRRADYEDGRNVPEFIWRFATDIMTKHRRAHRA